MQLGGDTVTIVRHPPPDRAGDPTGPAAETTVTGCSVQPATSSEHTDQANTVISGWVAYLPAGTDIRASDQVRWDGGLYEVDGQPGTWKDMDGQPHHVQVALRKVRG